MTAVDDEGVFYIDRSRISHDLIEDDLTVLSQVERVHVANQIEAALSGKPQHLFKDTPWLSAGDEDLRGLIYSDGYGFAIEIPAGVGQLSMRQQEWLTAFLTVAARQLGKLA